MFICYLLFLYCDGVSMMILGKACFSMNIRSGRLRAFASPGSRAYAVLFRNLPWMSETNYTRTHQLGKKSVCRVESVCVCRVETMNCICVLCQIGVRELIVFLPNYVRNPCVLSNLCSMQHGSMSGHLWLESGIIIFGD
ncbi:hypothetical protein M6B38_353630 [Iris pallida]|uniref:Secreted protein n=1 Tax=Iris pallida TaxID=29817 RepID=A0AAX6GPY5_IRIPA|nr:hypothetical protein M6B38_353630 [Iris pallida]